MILQLVTYFICFLVLLYYLIDLSEMWESEVIELNLDESQSALYPNFMICLSPEAPLDEFQSIEVTFTMSDNSNLSTLPNGYFVPMPNVRCVFYENHRVSTKHRLLVNVANCTDYISIGMYQLSPVEFWTIDFLNLYCHLEYHDSPENFVTTYKMNIGYQKVGKCVPNERLTLPKYPFTTSLQQLPNVTALSKHSFTDFLHNCRLRCLTITYLCAPEYIRVFVEPPLPYYNVSVLIIFQIPVYALESNRLLTPISLIWFAVQLFSTFFSVTLIQLVHLSLHSSQRLASFAFRRFHPRLKGETDKIKVSICCFLFVIYTFQLLDQYFNNNIVYQQKVSIERQIPERLGFSLCYNLPDMKEDSAWLDECVSSETQNLNTINSSSSIVSRWYEIKHKIYCFLNINYVSYMYLREDLLCLKITKTDLMIQDMYIRSMDRFGSTFLLLLPFLCEYDCSYLIVHSDLDMSRQADKITYSGHIPSVTMLIKHHLPAYTNCYNYEEADQISQAQCHEECLLNEHVEKYQMIPTFVSYNVDEAPDEWLNLSFTKQVDLEIQQNCRNLCPRIDCVQIKIQTFSISEYQESHFSISNIFFKFETFQVERTKTMAMIIQILTLFNLIMNINLYDLAVRYLNRLTFKHMRLCFQLAMVCLCVYVSMQLASEVFGNRIVSDVYFKPAVLRRDMAIMFCSANDSRLKEGTIQFKVKDDYVQYSLAEMQMNNLYQNYEYKKTKNILCLWISLKEPMPDEDMGFKIIVREGLDHGIYVDHINSKFPCIYLNPPIKIVLMLVRLENYVASSCVDSRIRKYDEVMTTLTQPGKNTLEEGLGVWLNFLERSVQLPDCFDISYYPTYVKSQSLNDQKNKIFVADIQYSNVQIIIKITPNFDLSQFVIMLLGILGLVLNFSMYQSLYNLLLETRPIWIRTMNPFKRTMYKKRARTQKLFLARNVRL
jgi:hypothetical protein